MKSPAIFILIMALWATPGFADLKVCTKEHNARKSTAQKPVYLTETEWRAAYEKLLELKPANPPGDGFSQALIIYLDNRELSEKYKWTKDKKQHCFMGCLFASQVNFETAEYMAWYKEKKDLTDCKSGSNFDLRDIDATLKGARYGTGSKKSVDTCYDWCDKNITKADR